MSAPNPHIRFRYQDYRSLPESMSKRYELLDGALLMVPALSTTHQRISRNLEYLLIEYCRQFDFGEMLYAPIDVVLGTGDEREVVQPDLILVAKSRLAIITEQEVCGAPDLVVEILSPGTEDRDRGYKKVLYARYGVQEYWIVDPSKRCIEVYVPSRTGFVRKAAYSGDEPLESPLLLSFHPIPTTIFP